VPDAPELIVIQGTLADAVQLHELLVVTVTVPLPPSFVKVALGGAIV
jgi:hypothetical protein